MVRRAGALWAVIVLAGLTAAWAPASDHRSEDGISIPAVGAAAPYPSQIVVSGLRGRVQDVDVTLRGLTHRCPMDVDVLLVGPSGAKSLLVSDAGGDCDPAAADVNVTVDDEALNAYPCGWNPGGRWRPTDVGDGSAFRHCSPAAADLFPAPAPPGPYPARLSAFDGEPANGTWRLFVVDDSEIRAGAIARGWRLAIDTDDDDRDGVADAQDRCPSVPAPTPDGCRNIRRTLRLIWQPRRKLFTAWLRASGLGNAACHRREMVRLYFVRRGPDRMVGRHHTSREGRVRMKWTDPFPGRYYVKASRVLEPEAGRCLGVRSNRVRVLRRETDGRLPYP